MFKMFKKQCENCDTMWKTFKMWEHNEYNNKIEWKDFSNKIIHGQRPDIVQGDYVLTKVISGRTVKLRIVRIEYSDEYNFIGEADGFRYID